MLYNEARNMHFKESIHKIVNVIQKIFSQNLKTHLFASVADPDPDPSGSEILCADSNQN